MKIKKMLSCASIVTKKYLKISMVGFMFMIMASCVILVELMSQFHLLQNQIRIDYEEDGCYWAIKEGL